MQTLTDHFRLLVGALFLHDEAYAGMRDADRPLTRGLVLVLSIALVFSLTAVVGDTLEWMALPEGGGSERTLWFQELGQGEPELAGLDFGWQMASWRDPSPLKAVLGLFINPLLLFFDWLLYGSLAHIYATVLGGRANRGQTYGCTALAFAPHLLNLVTVFPYAAVGGAAIIWSLACNYLALKNAHGLSPGRAFGATVLPLITLALFLLVLFALLVAAMVIWGGLGDRSALAYIPWS